MKIQFFGVKQDGIQIRETIRRMVERGRLGNFSLNSSSLLFREEAALQIEVCFAHGIADNFNKKKKKYLVFAMISAMTMIHLNVPLNSSSRNALRMKREQQQ